MKTRILLFSAAAALALSSCNNEVKTDGTATGVDQSQIDGLVNAKLDSLRTVLMAQNDSLINAMAQIKADSMVDAMRGGTASTTRPTRPTRPTTGGTTNNNSGSSTNTNGNTGKNTGGTGTNTGKVGATTTTTDGRTTTEGQNTGKRR